MDVVAGIEKATAATGRVVDAVDPEKLAGESPCEGWNARDVFNHLVGGLITFRMAAKDEEGSLSPSDDLLGDDPKGAYDEAASALVEAVKQPGARDGTWKLPFGEMPGEVGANIALMEICVHGWDLARATGQRMELDDETGELLWGTVQKLVSPESRQPGIFGPEQPAPDGAALVDRAAAYTGRKV